MVDPKRAAKLIREHFAKLTPEQFIENLNRACPEVLEEESNQILDSSSLESQQTIYSSAKLTHDEIKSRQT